MKEVKTFIRPGVCDELLPHLEAIGVQGMSVIDVSLLGNWTDQQKSHVSIEYCKQYSKAIKVELVCPDDLVEIVIACILDHAHSGLSGDGKIFVTNVETAVSIRTKHRGVAVLV